MLRGNFLTKITRVCFISRKPAQIIIKLEIKMQFDIRLNFLNLPQIWLKWFKMAAFHAYDYEYSDIVNDLAPGVWNVGGIVDS